LCIEKSHVNAHNHPKKTIAPFIVLLKLMFWIIQFLRRQSFRILHHDTFRQKIQSHTLITKTGILEMKIYDLVERG
jgi:hypothetical protein